MPYSSRSHLFFFLFRSPKMDYLRFRDNTEIIDSRLLTQLVQKHNVEYVTKPLERRQLWLALTREYNMARNSNLNHARLAKRWHNMKQRARKQITTIKRSAIRQRRSNIGSALLKIDPSEGEDKFGGKFVVLKGKEGEEAEEVLAEGEESEAHSKARQDALLRDLLICLAKKYKVEESKRGPTSKLRMWTDLSREYHRLSGGILNANAKQLQNKWTNIKFNAKNKGKPNPYDVEMEQDAEGIAKKLLPFKRILEDEHVEKEIEAHLQQDYLFASAMHGHKMSMVKGDRGASPPPVTAAKKRSDYEMDGGPAEPSYTLDFEAVAGTGHGDVTTHNKTLRNIEKHIYMETLKFEQERLRLYKANAELERQKLIKDVEASELNLQLMRAEYEKLQAGTIRILQ